MHYLFSVEQKKVTQGFRMLLSDEGGRYIASEKQVSNNRKSSVLKQRKSCPIQHEGQLLVTQMWSSAKAQSQLTHLFRSWI